MRERSDSAPRTPTVDAAESLASGSPNAVTIWRRVSRSSSCTSVASGDNPSVRSISLPSRMYPANRPSASASAAINPLDANKNISHRSPLALSRSLVSNRSLLVFRRRVNRKSCYLRLTFPRLQHPNQNHPRLRRLTLHFFLQAVVVRSRLDEASLSCVLVWNPWRRSAVETRPEKPALRPGGGSPY